MASITFDNVTRLFAGSEQAAVDKLDLVVEDGELLVLVGPSGCGKSTTLRMLAGLEDVDGGRILIDGQDITHAGPRERDIAMVFQNYALYPHLTVAANLGFALTLAKVDKLEIARRVGEAAKILDLTEYLGRKPGALSGGQRQRVAMGRAIVRSPRVFLMDEPLSNLDAKLRVQTRTQITQLQRRLHTTMVYVTHDQVEAMTMGDRVAVLKAGVLQQCAPPRELYRNPVNAFVAGFMGSPSMNQVLVPVDDRGAHFGDQTVAVSRSARASLNAPEAILGIRPEHMSLAESGLAFEVDVVEELGSEAFLFGRASLADGTIPLVVKIDYKNPPGKGDVVHVRIDESQVHLFDTTKEGRRIAA
ncbi:MAG: ABC transporter ATP-binding protein [Rhodococcus sp. (in: high G+C Gram-positive bacteria)]